ncbi:MAG: hypothetical protein M3137_11120 [Actinomycetota bacterium]|nr:hypothetical protein [Actinomycetota bacterium]
MTSPAADLPPQARVADRLQDAADLVAQGQEVVLLVPAATAPEAMTALGDGAGPGRVALFVGDPVKPSDHAGAEAMAAELFGRR